MRGVGGALYPKSAHAGQNFLLRMVTTAKYTSLRSELDDTQQTVMNPVRSGRKQR